MPTFTTSQHSDIDSETLLESFIEVAARVGYRPSSFDDVILDDEQAELVDAVVVRGWTIDQTALAYDVHRNDVAHAVDLALFGHRERAHACSSITNGQKEIYDMVVIDGRRPSRVADTIGLSSQYVEYTVQLVRELLPDAA
ncbi:hypothetical protein [Desertimonas flava]|uniref:hypothetical protein n=1 Tax=Desertimonas flava TaxID=2064846 RepID=UPI0013C3E55E|nr:hypothetical protein [Desertimonas flava]